MYQLKKLKSLLLLLCIAVTAKAQLESGKVYNFVNVGKGASMSIKAVDGANVVATDQSNYSQLWYAASENGGFTLRNLANGYYLQSPNATSSAWTMVKVKDENCIFTPTSVGDNYAIRVTGNSGDYNYMHADGGGNIVCWESSNTNSQWTMNVVDIDAATLNANWNTLSNIDPSPETAAAYKTALDNLFSDKACTTLKKSFANENAVKNDADYKALPATLQEMVLKVYNDSWAEENFDANKSDWDADYAKKYRVQLYEPYNNVNAAAQALGLNAHTNLNNPTGIFANSKEAVYVMVQGTIKDGASLYLTSYTGHGKLGNDHTEGIRLTEGLNIVPSFADGNNYIINYVVETFDVSNGKRGNKARARKLSDYAPLKIHFEGGYINGYYNKVGDELYTPDKNADWEYIEARATQTDVTVLGKYITLQFPLNDDHTEGNKGLKNFFNDQVFVEDCIDEWDNVMLWERLVLGVLDETTTKAEAKTSPYSSKDVFEYTGNDADGYNSGYGDYYNVHGLSFGVGGDAYMYGGWDHCGYHYNTMGSILTNLPYNAGSHWGPGHEIGHQHQSLLTVNGLTEVTNNLFSNVVLWYYGETTSRYNGSDGALSNVLAAYNTEDSDFFTNNIWALTHMYYKLFLYYHVLGHNTKFYPRLFEMLRQDPMSGGYNQNGATSLLHFYKKCCLASGDDLTEFFRAHGFFSVMDNRLVGDYSNSVYTTTQADIDAAIKEVKDLGYDENIAVLFINDATGETIKSHKGDNLELYGETTVCAEVGSYASFADNTTPDYTYSVSGSTVTMEGTGGTGFAIFNEKGEIIAFSDKKTFEVSSECAVAIASGKAEIKAVQADNTIIEAVDVMDTDNAEAKYEALGELLTATADLLTYADADNSKPGFYRASVMETLQQLYDEAQSVYNNKKVASYATAYAALAQEYTRIAALDTDKTPFLPGSTYVLTNKKYPNVSMALDNNALIASATNMSNSAQQWTFEATDEADIYYLKNGSNYMGSLSQSTQVGVTTKELASRYKLFDLGKGLWALQCQNDLEKLMSLHCNEGYKIVGWTHTATDNDGSWWYLTATVKDESMLPLYDLQNLVEKTEALVDEMATVQYKGGAIDMSTCTITSNATETGHETKYLTDGNPSTFFHTVWSGSVVNDYHNIVIDLGEGHSLAEFVLNYSTLPTTANNVDAPESLTIQGSNDGSSYTDIAALSNGLPTSKGSEYTSSTLGSASQAYRYIRLQVKTATGGKLGSYYYFGLAELSLLRMATLVDAIGDKYQNFVTADALKAACDQVYAAQQTIAMGSATSDDVAALQAQYDILLAAYENANNVEFNAKKEELLALISSTNSLINECGTIKIVEGGDLALSTSQGSGDAYFTQWSHGSSDGAFANLIDGSVSTFYVSNWSNTPAEHPYLQVQLPEGKELGKFTFTFTGRKDGNAPTPTKIVVSGSSNGSTFTEIETFTKDDTWPVAANNSTIMPKTWTSSTIAPATAYKYLRFTITAAERSDEGEYNTNGVCHYGISEFGVSRVGETIVMLSGEHGEATEELLLATNEVVLTAQATYDRATTEAQLQSAITALQSQYDALFNAKYPSVEFSISVTGGNGNGGVVYKDTPYTTTLLAPEILTVGELAAIPLDGYEAKSVTLDGTTITVTYNKVYTVKVTGGNGNGGITYDGKDYADGTTFDAEQGSFSVNELTAIIPDGYILKEAITLNHETGVINVAFSARPLVDVTKYYTLACKATDHGAYIRDNSSVINGRSTEGSLFQFEAADDDNGYYIKSYVTGKYINHTTDGSNKVYASGENNTIWTMAVPSHTPKAHTLTVGNYLYLNNVEGDCTDGSCTYLQSKEHPGGTGSGNACSLWTITEGTPLDMTDLKNLIDATNNLIISCYQNGNVDGELLYINSAHVTADLMTDIKTAVANAQAKYDAGRATTQGEYDTVLVALQNANTTLTNEKMSADAEAAERNTQRTALNNLITTTNDLITLCGTTPGDATQALIDEVSAAVTSAQAVAEYMGSTVEQLTNATTTLQGQYNVLLAAQQSTAKTELRTLIVQTEALIAQCGEVTFEEEMLQDKITLQTNNESEAGYLFCNAPYLADPTSKDYSPASEEYYILDEDYTTFLHTDWSDSAPSEDHYLRVSLGEIELTQFILKYSTRGGGGDIYPGNPKRIVVEGCNSVDGDYEEIAVLTSEDEGNGLPQGSQLSHYTSNVLENSENYKYIRFRVTENESNRKVNEHCWFYISEFALMSVDYECEYTVVVDVNAGSVTKELLLDVFRANDDAKTLADNSSVQAELIAEKERLQVLYDELLEAYNNKLPVTLTTDATAPVLYTIKTKRGGNPVLQYDEATEMFSVTTAVAGQATQAFYFMKGDKVEGTQQVYIYPYMADGKVLAANDVTDGKEKALAMDKGTATYEQWVFVERADGYYNLQPAGTTTYLSNIYGTSSKMGFYSSNPAGDEGSLLMFEATIVEGGYYYLKLKNYYETQVKVASSEIQGGTAVGYYPVAQATAYNTAYAAATEALANTETTEVEYQTAYTNLVAANEALEINMPEVGKYYTIASACSDHRGGQLMYSTGENAMVFSREMTRVKPEALWTFTSEGYLENLQTGCSVSTASIEGAKHKLGESPKKVDIKSISVDGQVLLTPNGGQPLHAQDNGSVVVGWGAYDAGSASAWRIVEVTDEELSNVEFALTIGQYRHAGLYLNYATKIPEGVKVYIAHTPNGDEGSIIADEIDGTILPARTAVIVKGDAATYNFKYTTADYDGSEDLKQNLLGGSAYLKYQQVETAGKLCCAFGQKSGVVGLYKNWVGYIDANGTAAEDENGDGKVNQDNGTHFKISANKIYYEYKPSDVAGASAFRFRFSSKEEETTTIDELLMHDDTIIYNLNGQRIAKVVEPGIYIVNGKKLFVTEKMIGNNK